MEGVRRELEGRPLVLLLLGLLLGLTSILNPFNLVFLVPLLAVARSVRSWCLVAAALLVGLVLAPGKADFVTSPTYMDERAQDIGVTAKMPDGIACNAVIGNLRVRLFFPPSTQLHMGDVWEVSGVVRPPSLGSEALALEEGVQGSMKVDRGRLVAAGPSLFAFADSWRDGFERFTHSIYGKDDADWIDALCFRSNTLSRADKEELRTSGLSYLVSASGLHVFVLGFIVATLLGALRAPRPVQIVVTATVLLLYCLATGIHFSTVRAALASVLFLSAYLVGRDPDALSALAVAALGYLLLFPGSVYSLGFQLSVVIVAALALFMPRLRVAEPTARGLIRNGAVSAAWAAGIILLAGQPIVALAMGRFSVAQIPANLLTGLVAPFAIGLSFVAYGLQPVSPTLAAGVLHMAQPLAGFIRQVSTWFGGDTMSIGLPAFSGYWLLLYYGLWLATWRPRRAIA